MMTVNDELEMIC